MVRAAFSTGTQKHIAKTGSNMRMWMVKPVMMCGKHLLGEHVELHMIFGHLIRGRHIRGFVANNCVEPTSLFARHEIIVAEMWSRGYRHRSPMTIDYKIFDHLDRDERACNVDRAVSLAELIRRCKDCGHLYDRYIETELKERHRRIIEGMWEI